MSISQEEKQCVEELLPMLSEKPVIFDIGANKGSWSDIVMNKIPDARIYFFEANLVLIHYLMMKYDYNENQIEYINKAVCNQHNRTCLFFYFTNKNNGLSSIYNNPEWDTLPKKLTTVQSITIDGFCSENNIQFVDFIKIDIEGAEHEAFLGMTRLLKNKGVRHLQIEYSPHYKISHSRFYSIMEYAYSFGYNVYLYEDGAFIPVTNQTFVEDYVLRNYIITLDVLSDTQDWNRVFKESVQDLPKVELALEVGCFEGKTTKYIHDNMLLPGGRVVCIDPLEDEYLTDNLDEAAVKMNTELPYFKSQYTRFVRNTRGIHMNLIRKRSADAYIDLFFLRFGFIYIDGDHREEAVYKDGIECFEVCKVGGHILFDDYTWSEGTKKGIDRFLNERAQYIEIVKMDYQVLIKRIA